VNETGPWCHVDGGIRGEGDVALDSRLRGFPEAPRALAESRGSVTLCCRSGTDALRNGTDGRLPKLPSVRVERGAAATYNGTTLSELAKSAADVPD